MKRLEIPEGLVYNAGVWPPAAIAEGGKNMFKITLGG